ncbi:MAG: drug/metabolite-transporting permease [Bacteroidetes bacterium]|nr:drug/metabolite-transporting permease [Bacteroidota bacterium]
MQGSASSPSSRTNALIAVGLVSILWGTTWMASKVGVQYIPALQLSGLRHLIGGGIYVLFFLLYKRMVPTRNHWFRLIWMSVLMFVLSNGLSVLSIVYMPSGLGAVVGALSPIWVVVFSFVFVKKAIFKPLTIIGIVLGFAGVVVTFFEFYQKIMDTDLWLGILFGSISSITWAIATLLTVKQSEHIDPYFSLGWQMFISGVLLNTISYASGRFVSYDNVPANAWLSIAYLIIIGSVLAFGAYIYALKRLPATLVSIHSYINPIVAILLGDLLMHEKLTIYIITGTLITLVGIYLVNSSFKR